jgi:hypothetical protein
VVQNRACTPLKRADTRLLEYSRRIDCYGNDNSLLLSPGFKERGAERRYNVCTARLAIGAKSGLSGRAVIAKKTFLYFGILCFLFGNVRESQALTHGRRERVCRSKRFVDKAIMHLWEPSQKY